MPAPSDQLSYKNAFCETDPEGVITGDVHLVNDSLKYTACGLRVGGSWVSRPPGLFYGERRLKKHDRLCPHCKERS